MKRAFKYLILSFFLLLLCFILFFDKIVKLSIMHSSLPTYVISRVINHFGFEYDVFTGEFSKGYNIKNLVYPAGSSQGIKRLHLSSLNLEHEFHSDSNLFIYRIKKFLISDLFLQIPSQELSVETPEEKKSEHRIIEKNNNEEATQLGIVIDELIFENLIFTADHKYPDQFIIESLVIRGLKLLPEEKKIDEFFLKSNMFELSTSKKNPSNSYLTFSGKQQGTQKSNDLTVELGLDGKDFFINIKTKDIILKLLSNNQQFLVEMIANEKSEERFPVKRLHIKGQIATSEPITIREGFFLVNQYRFELLPYFKYAESKTSLQFKGVSELSSDTDQEISKWLAKTEVLVSFSLLESPHLKLDFFINDKIETKRNAFSILYFNKKFAQLQPDEQAFISDHSIGN